MQNISTLSIFTFILKLSYFFQFILFFTFLFIFIFRDYFIFLQISIYFFNQISVTKKQKTFYFFIGFFIQFLKIF